MRIATNTPPSFFPTEGFDFPQLINARERDPCVLMLPKNWGMGSISQISALTDWVAGRPLDVLCCIAGCEVTMPDNRIWAYPSEARDGAVRALCKQVLLRSKTIGVRGEITQSYLIEQLGFDADRIEVIYDRKATDNIYRAFRFLKNNDLPSDIHRSVVAFQQSPYVRYELSTLSEPAIQLSAPRLTVSGAMARVSADYRLDGRTRTIWCETDAQHAEYMVYDRSDAFIAALLPLAMRAGKDIICEAPVSDQLLHNLSEVLIPHLSNHDARLHKTRIKAAATAEPISNSGAVATGMSCGVDSLFSTFVYSRTDLPSVKLTHLYCGNYLYGNDSAVYGRARSVSDAVGLPLVSTRTNINEEVDMPHVYTHFFKIMFGVLTLRKLFAAYVYSSAEDFSHFGLKNNSLRDTAEYELLLLYCFTFDGLRMIAGGAQTDRVDKTAQIGGYSIAHRFLNVCLYPEQPINCGVCNKCIRTMLALDMQGTLDQFHAVFDLVDYRANRLRSFVHMVKLKDTIWMANAYAHFQKTEPALVAQAHAVVDGKPVAEGPV